MNHNAVQETKATAAELDRAYSEEFIPAVHRIGIPFSILGILFMFLPVLYFWLVCGYSLSSSWIISVIISVVSICGYDWISEPLTYYPMMGSAALYMGFLAGNVYNQRLPVAIAAQKVTKAETHSLKGQVITIIGVGVSVFCNLALLLLTVVAGDKLLAVLPAVIVSAFSFSLPAMMGVTFPMFLETEKGYFKGFLDNLPYIVVGVAAIIFADNHPVLSSYDIMFATLCTVAYSFLHYLWVRHKEAKVND